MDTQTVSHSPEEVRQACAFECAFGNKLNTCVMLFLPKVHSKAQVTGRSLLQSETDDVRANMV